MHPSKNLIVTSVPQSVAQPQATQEQSMSAAASGHDPRHAWPRHSRLILAAVMIVAVVALGMAIRQILWATDARVDRAVVMADTRFLAFKQRQAEQVDAEAIASASISAAPRHLAFAEFKLQQIEAHR